MILDKDNYEFLMFEMLEGNLDDVEANNLIQQINASPFYQKEWQLMQHTLVVPNMEIGMPNKAGLEKHEGKTLLLFTWPRLVSIAASLLFIGTFGILYYSSEKNESQLTSTSQINHLNPTPSESLTASPSKVDSIVQLPKSIVNIGESRTESFIVQKKSNGFQKRVKNDSSASTYQPELMFLHSIETDKIVYQSIENKMQQTKLFNLAPPTAKSQTKLQRLMVKADAITKTSQLIWNDLPNLTFRMSPNLKSRNRSIGIEIKGETIYANAIIELK